MRRSFVTAEFVVSAAGPQDFPTDGLFEIALVGRSNVGKSTLMNALVGRRLARTSAAPGKTRLINFYRAQAGATSLYLADLPGYGYARGGAEARRAFDALTREYFSRRRMGAGRVGPAETLLLVDARHPGLASDLEARRYFREWAIPTIVVATKIDKVPRAARGRIREQVGAALQAPVVPVSAVTGEGLKELWNLILAQARPA